MSNRYDYRIREDLGREEGSTRGKVDPVSIAFQPDAVEIEERSLPRAAHIALFLILGLLMFALIWASWAQIDRTVNARGKLISQARTVVMQPFQSSIILELNARPGDYVRKGDLIAALDPTLNTADRSQLQSRIAVLRAEAARIMAERAGTELPPAEGDPHMAAQQALLLDRRAEKQAFLDGFDARIAELQSQAGVAAAKETQISAQLDLAQVKLANATQLVAANSGSKLRQSEARAAVIQFEAALIEKVREQERYGRQEIVVEAERQQYLSKWDRELRDRQLAIADEVRQLEFELEKAQRVSDFDAFYAEADGIVQDVTKKSVGSVVESAEVLFTMVPLDKGLDLELELSARDIGWVVVGQPVRIKLDPFPFQRHGTLEGTLTSLSPDAFQRDVGNQTEVYYRARVAISENNLRNLPDGFQMVPGITATAEVRIGKRTVLSYVTDPFHRALDESLKEPN